jgi:hypothetical protein
VDTPRDALGVTPVLELLWQQSIVIPIILRSPPHPDSTMEHRGRG